jgi:hypothetical protein
VIARDFASPSRGIDRGFIARQRAKGTPEAAIARMGGWCLADVRAVPHDPFIQPVPRPEPAPKPVAALDALAIPEVAEILRHVAEQYDVTVNDILGHSHSQESVEPRHEAFAVVYELNRYTLDDLGGIFNKTGNAVLYGLRRHYERLRHRGPGRDW